MIRNKVQISSAKANFWQTTSKQSSKTLQFITYLFFCFSQTIAPLWVKEKRKSVTSVAPEIILWENTNINFTMYMWEGLGYGDIIVSLLSLSTFVFYLTWKVLDADEWFRIQVSLKARFFQTGSLFDPTHVFHFFFLQLRNFTSQWNKR